MKRLYLLLTLILLLAGHCFAFGATFSETHVCLPFGLSASRCKLAQGDTVSQSVATAYGSWRHYKAMFMKANPTLTDPNKVKVGQWIVLPNVPTMHRVQSRTAATLALKRLKIRYAIINTTPIEASTVEIPEEEIASAEIQPLSQPLPALTPVAEPTVEVAAKKKVDTEQAVTGYKVVIPKAVAAASGVPLGIPLVTHYYLYSPDTHKPCGYIRLAKKSYARVEGQNVVLYVPLRTLPSQEWSLDVSGINGLIEDRTFVANAQPVHGTIPGPHHLMRTLYGMAGTGGSGFMIAQVLGPFAGGGITIGIIAFRAYMQHHANVIVEHAERNYNAVLANQNTISLKETGQ